MYVGSVGAGKTYCAVAEAIKDAGDYIITNTPLNQEKLAELYGVRKDIVREEDQRQVEEGTKAVRIWKDFSDDIVKEAKCGTLLIDEAPLWLDARKWDTLSHDARQKIIEHRKDDLLICSTAQDVSFIDKVYRILADEVRVVRKVSLPFLGYFFPHSIRPTIWCCNCGRMRRDGVGDESSKLKKIFGFGTVYVWEVYKPTVLAKEQDASASDIPEEKAIGRGFRLYDHRIAEVYDTSRKLSAVASDAVKARRDAQRQEAYQRKNVKKSNS